MSLDGRTASNYPQLSTSSSAHFMCTSLGQTIYRFRCTVIVRLIEKIWPSFDLSKSLKVKENGVRNLIHV